MLWISHLSISYPFFLVFLHKHFEVGSWLFPNNVMWSYFLTYRNPVTSALFMKGGLQEVEVLTLLDICS